MPALVEGFSEVFGILKELASGVKTAIELKENQKNELRDAIAKTAELVDQTLAIVKQHLTSVISELKFRDRQNAKIMIAELASFPGWEDKYRRFQLCDALRLATDNLERKGLYKYLNKISFNDPKTIQRRMFDYIGGEVNAAKSVVTMLESLAPFADSVDSDFEMVLRNLEEARNEVGKLRQAFIDLEIEIRNSI
ncbi:MAG: hypothetical protein JZU47_02510 [Prolixibacteraceae bacterium]|jgi:hypothetical protein|nr:hypothetical protein [Prolixibacteraceae bacterium]